jgi:hypothetical protein
MGGGSSIMRMWSLRGVPSDDVRWVADGAEGWGFDGCCRISGAPRRTRTAPAHVRDGFASAPRFLRRVTRIRTPAERCFLHPILTNLSVRRTCTFSAFFVT